MSSQYSNTEQARRDLGQRLRELRKDAGLTARAMAEAVGWHESKCSKLQSGRTVPSDEDIRTWAQLCGVPEEADDLIATVRATEGAYIEWRRIERAGLKRAQEAATPIFDRTSRFRSYSSWLIPGHLQTADYTRAVLLGTATRRGLSQDVEEAVAVRMQRQHVLNERGRLFAVLLEESVLYKLIGGPEVMVGQLGQLVTAGSLPAVSLGIIPDTADRSGIHPVEDFWIFDDTQVNVELVAAWLTVTQPGEIAEYARTFAELASLAVYGASARLLITKAINALG
ncbi:helix-turn-helix transcriptional regulator [Kitasatospora sp. NPDC005856]|uniref:helix-turn-helix domain-containing protein n=1 Tax=Kitasatospora sp. NPDC005856 TaxID=3154566 RepID=UPI0033D2E1C9